MNLNFKLIFGVVAVFILAYLGVSIYDSSTVNHVQNCKIMDLQQQQIVKGSKDNIKTEIRYLVITDKETFVCESSLLNGKFNNSDIFWRLKKDSTYTFEVAGIGKTAMTDYRNILSFK